MIIREDIEHPPFPAGDGEEIGIHHDAGAADLRHEDALRHGGQAERVSDAKVDAIVIGGAGIIPQRLEGGGRGGGIDDEVNVLVVIVNQRDLPLVRERGERVLGIGDVGSEIVSAGAAERILPAGAGIGDLHHGRRVIHRDDDGRGSRRTTGIGHGEHNIITARAGDGESFERIGRRGGGAVPEIPCVSQHRAVRITRQRAAELHRERAGSILPVHAGHSHGRAIAAGRVINAAHCTRLIGPGHRAVVEPAGPRVSREKHKVSGRGKRPRIS